jgi:hypothetical protein
MEREAEVIIIDKKGTTFDLAIDYDYWTMTREQSKV